MKKITLFLAGAFMSTFLNAQNVNIPNTNFKNALLAHGAGITGTNISVIDANGDGEISISEAQAYTGRIDVGSKNISDLTGIEAFTRLKELVCYFNKLTSLDVSNNSNLSFLNTQDNQLTSLNVANGNNGGLSAMYAHNNPNLGCIQHDAGFAPTSKANWRKDATASWSTNCNPCTNTVSIPDANFKNALLAHGTTITGAGISVIDTDGDGEICQTEAQAYTGTINVSNKGISNLTGIEAFTNLTRLDCYDNSLSNLGISNNTALTHLNCYRNQLTSLDVFANTALTYLDCLGNQINNLKLSISLQYISISENKLTSIDTSSITNLEYLYCDINELTSIDISANTKLKELLCRRNNNLIALNLANGRNANLNTVYANLNPSLTCIQHDAGYRPTSYWAKDATANWSDNCNYTCTTSFINIPDANFKAALLDHGVGIRGVGISVIDTDGDGKICNTEAQAYTGLIKVRAKNISDLTGVEEFVNLTELDCIGNQLTSLDVSANTDLKRLECSYNQLTSISANTNLKQWSSANNQLTSLNLSIYTALTELALQNNQLTSLDLSANTALTAVNCSNNQLTSLNISNGNNTNVTLMFAYNNSNLSCIQNDSGFDPTTKSDWRKDATASWSDNCTPASTNDLTFNNAVTLYPNPVSGKLYINAENANISSVKIYNVLGKKVTSTSEKQIEVGNLPNGMYILKIISAEGKIATKKFIKQ